MINDTPYRVKSRANKTPKNRGGGASSSAPVDEVVDPNDDYISEKLDSSDPDE